MAKNKGSKVSTPPVQVPVEPTDTDETQVPLTNVQRLDQTEARLNQMVQIVNNLIQYCNTLEQWRTLTFKPADAPKTEEQHADDSDFNGENHDNNHVTASHTEKVPATTSE